MKAARPAGVLKVHLLALLLSTCCYGQTSMPGLGQSVPDFALPDQEGRRVSPSDYRGKVLLLNFFAFWCDTWKEELTRLRDLRLAHPELEFDVLFVSVDSRERSLAEPLMINQGLHFPVAIDVKSDVSRAYGITTVPTLFILDPDGKVRASYQGYPGNRLLVRDLRSAAGPRAAAKPLESSELKEFLLTEELKLWRSINSERKKRGLRELVLDTALTEVGREYLQRTASEPLRHASGPQSPDARVRARGITFAKLGENLARSKTAAEALQGMLESPSHKTNLLHPRYAQIGVAAFRDPSNDRYCFCLLFTEPRQP